MKTVSKVKESAGRRLAREPRAAEPEAAALGGAPARAGAQGCFLDVGGGEERTEDTGSGEGGLLSFPTRIVELQIAFAHFGNT